MLAKGDVVIALSASGETEEILRLLANIKRIGDALISFCCDMKSTLRLPAMLRSTAAFPLRLAAWGWRLPLPRQPCWPSETRWPSRFH
jgi:arabinose-5-phosphate isomerase